MACRDCALDDGTISKICRKDIIHHIHHSNERKVYTTDCGQEPRIRMPSSPSPSCNDFVDGRALSQSIKRQLEKTTSTTRNNSRKPTNSDVLPDSMRVLKTCQAKRLRDALVRMLMRIMSQVVSISLVSLPLMAFVAAEEGGYGWELLVWYSGCLL